MADRSAARHVGIDVSAAEETEAAVVEIVFVEFVDAGLRGPRSEKRIEPAVLEMNVHTRHRLMTEVFADDTGTGLRVVRLSYPRHQQVLGVRHRERRENDDVGRLLVFLAGHQIDIANPANLFRILVVVDFGHVGVELEFETRSLLQHWIQQNFWARLGVGLTNETFTMAAVLALSQLHSVRIRIGVWRIARWHGKRLVAEALGGLRKNQTRFGRWQR